MKNSIIVSDRFRNYIEALAYEKNSRANLIDFMLSNDINNEEMFQKIHTEYVEFYTQYEFAKRHLEEHYLMPTFGKISGWHLDFHSKEVIIHE